MRNRPGIAGTGHRRYPDVRPEEAAGRSAVQKSPTLRMRSNRVAATGNQQSGRGSARLRGVVRRSRALGQEL
jgi:hypothetical protein